MAPLLIDWDRNVPAAFLLLLKLIHSPALEDDRAPALLSVHAIPVASCFRVRERIQLFSCKDCGWRAGDPVN